MICPNKIYMKLRSKKYWTDFLTKNHHNSTSMYILYLDGQIRCVKVYAHMYAYYKNNYFQPKFVFALLLASILSDSKVSYIQGCESSSHTQKSLSIKI